jgi:hypothetical protein
MPRDPEELGEKGGMPAQEKEGLALDHHLMHHTFLS